MIFVLVGSEALLVKRALDKLLSERLEPASKDFNCDIFEGSDLSTKKVAKRLPPILLTTRKPILIEEWRMAALVTSWSALPATMSGFLSRFFSAAARQK